MLQCSGFALFKKICPHAQSNQTIRPKNKKCLKVELKIASLATLGRPGTFTKFLDYAFGSIHAIGESSPFLEQILMYLQQITHLYYPVNIKMYCFLRQLK